MSTNATQVSLQPNTTLKMPIAFEIPSVGELLQVFQVNVNAQDLIYFALECQAVCMEDNSDIEEDLSEEIADVRSHPKDSSLSDRRLGDLASGVSSPSSQPLCLPPCNTPYTSPVATLSLKRPAECIADEDSLDNAC
ncbi:hypothetical protein GYMLUDRAFT_235894 [Collybiopsis luxurians FD-317 M1]|nr:hypothetical protein GYMLUDRAFT_235894 [Collybiopsis luxurians FD-317 M1]